MDEDEDIYHEVGNTLNRKPFFVNERLTAANSLHSLPINMRSRNKQLN